MIRLVLVLGVVCALWPVDKDNRPLGIHATELELADVMSAGFSVVEDAAGFCARNPQTCHTVTTGISDVTASVRDRLLNSSSPQDHSQGDVKDES